MALLISAVPASYWFGTMHYSLFYYSDDEEIRDKVEPSLSDFLANNREAQFPRSLEDLQERHADYFKDGSVYCVRYLPSWRSVGSIIVYCTDFRSFEELKLY